MSALRRFLAIGRLFEAYKDEQLRANSIYVGWTSRDLFQRFGIQRRREL